MEVQTAIRLIELVVYKPDWTIDVEDGTNRYEGGVKVRITAPSRRTEREEAANGFPTEIMPYADFMLQVGSVQTPAELMTLLFTEAIMRFELHEAREFFRVLPSYWAPLHPHREDGMKRWGKVYEDMTYGLA